jgi:hypothetical protein
MGKGEITAITSVRNTTSSLLANATQKSSPIALKAVAGNGFFGRRKSMILIERQ